MGQYYKPMSIDKKQFVYTHDLKETYTHDGRSWESGQGLKLMEHSYIGNPVMNLVERLLQPGGAWFMTRVIWAGDYADGEADQKKNKHGEKPNLYFLIDDENGSGEKIEAEEADYKTRAKGTRFVINHTKQVYVDTRKIKADSDGFKIHPLSLFVAEGNGRGGGDFHGEDPRIGTWARDIISVEAKAPKGFKEVDGVFKEDR